MASCSEAEVEAYSVYLDCTKAIPRCEEPSELPARQDDYEACLSSLFETLEICETECSLRPYGVIIDCF